MFKSSEMERLYRDVRCGGFHPANSMLAHEIIAKTVTPNPRLELAWRNT